MSSVEDKLPEGWIETTLGEAVDRMYSGGTPSTKRDEYYGGGIPWIRTQEVVFNFIYTTDIRITELGLKKSSAKYIPIDTVIVAMYGNSAGRVALSKIKATTNQACCNIITNSEVTNPYFIFYNLMGRYKEIEGKANGAAQQNLSVGVLKQLEINLPPIQEQKAIANVLTAFDDKIENLRSQNQTLEQTAQTIFKEWFGKYQIDDELPEGWRVGKIVELFEVRDGTHDSPKQCEQGKLLITSKHITKERIKFEEAYLISDEDFISINKRSVVEQFDILFSMIGTLGLTYLEQNSEIDYAIKNLALFKTSQNRDWSIYTYLWLTSKNGKHYVIKNKGGSTQQFMSLSSLRNIEFVMPREKRLLEFNNICKPIFKKLQINNEQIQSLTKTRDTLLPKLMRGELRVNGFKK